MKPHELANEIISFAKPGGLDVWTNSPGKTFGIGPSGVHIPSEYSAKYEKLLDQLFEISKSLSKTYTRKEFESRLASLLAPYIENASTLTNEKGREIIRHLEEAPIQNFRVSRPIQGINLSPEAAIFEIGTYTISKFDQFNKTLQARNPHGDYSLEIQIKSPYFIETTVAARHYEKALELADLRFERFEKILRFAIGYNTNRYDAGILNYQGWRGLSAYICADDGGISFINKKVGAHQSIPIDDPFFSLSENGFDRLWGMTNNGNLSEFESRLLLSIEWIGQSFRENSLASAFLNSAIAMEIIFNYNEKTIISPSILSQISESIALVLGDDVKGRLFIEGQVKKLYSFRSSIAHSGKSEISLEDLHSLFEIARTTIIVLLTSKAFVGIDSIAALHRKLKELKYSGPSI